MGSAVAAAWLLWLRRQGAGTLALCLFAIVPTPIWFILVVSTDLLFAAEFALFFLCYFATKRSAANTVGWSTALMAMVLTRPNSFALLLFVAFDTVWSFYQEGRIRWARAIGSVALLAFGGMFLYPYFVAEMSKAAHSLQYFGYTPYEYLEGLDLPSLADWIRLPLSWIALFGAKLLYFTGLRPTYGLTSDVLVLVRAAPGLILLPGLLLLMLTAPARIRLLAGLYCLPFLLGPAQERYYIAIFPLFFLHGTRFWATVWMVALRAIPLKPRGAHSP
jgi:hypothetical protein